jgi:tryptophan halogenase
MKNLVILGGGTAGWLTALYLKKQFCDNNIIVIEDPNRPPIIAGESGGASLVALYKFLEIDLNEWIIEANALPKLGGKFFDWNGPGTSFTHGLIDRDYDKDHSVKFPALTGINREFLSCALASNIPVEDLFYNSALINANKLPIILNESTGSYDAIDTPMWHFDSRANAAYLKKLGLAKGITLVEGEYLTSEKNYNGSLYSISLDTEEKIYGDWFFDCSGFSRLLLNKEMGVEFQDYSKLFPARSVVGWWNDDSKLINYTAVTAMKFGWSWNINLKNRSGNGYVFDPDHITVDQAIAEAEQRFNTKIEPVAKLNFVPSLAKECWKNNVIAIGLSSGFLEPLESNGLAQVSIQLELLEKYWNPESVTDLEIKLFNRYFNSAMDEILNFLLLHYKGNRRDTDFWCDHHIQFKTTTAFLGERIASWQEGGFCDDQPAMQIYSLESYFAVVKGLNLVDCEKLKSKLLARRSSILQDFTETHKQLHNKINWIVEKSMTMEEWYKRTYGGL